VHGTFDHSIYKRQLGKEALSERVVNKKTIRPQDIANTVRALYFGAKPVLFGSEFTPKIVTDDPIILEMMKNDNPMSPGKMIVEVFDHQSKLEQDELMTKEEMEEAERFAKGEDVIVKRWKAKTAKHYADLLAKHKNDLGRLTFADVAYDELQYYVSKLDAKESQMQKSRLTFLLASQLAVSVASVMQRNEQYIQVFRDIHLESLTKPVIPKPASPAPAPAPAPKVELAQDAPVLEPVLEPVNKLE
jgi:hypothetical protein